MENRKCINNNNNGTYNNKHTAYNAISQQIKIV